MTGDRPLLQTLEADSFGIDPTVKQRRAANPEDTVWVNASAGTGKTKVLTDRVLRLLLPREDGRDGSKPHKIICLTFTKAAAAEMALRINQTLSSWAVSTDSELREKLQDLLGKPPTPLMMKEARKLFVTVLDSPGGLNILTIHAFCQSVLTRFPLEAGISPGFRVAEEAESANLLAQVKADLLAARTENGDAELSLAILEIVQTINEKDFAGLIRSLTAESTQLRRILRKFPGKDARYKAVCEDLGINSADTPEDIIKAFCERDVSHLQLLCAALLNSGKNDQKIGAGLQIWLENTPPEREAYLSIYKDALLTKDGTIRSISKSLIKNMPQAEILFELEASRFQDFEEKMKALTIARQSCHLMTLGEAMLSRYAAKKEALGVLDFEDLITKTLDLLTGAVRGRANAPWVLFKLDGGIDHILIDEAQDTNPEQWEVLRILSEEFMSGAGQADSTRTVFVVGDEKQSIYSFQRAAPREFERMRGYFEEKIRILGSNLVKEDLITSFRSTKSVLELVDTVFSTAAMRKGLGSKPLQHIPSDKRRGQAGHVEVWPLTKKDEGEDVQDWTPPVTIHEQRSAYSKLANHIADKIQSWIGNKLLESRGRPIKPGDVMILIRTRTAFVGHMVRALKVRGIPVSGVDRMVLNASLAIQDLMALAQFALLPDDDLTLAVVLKSPFVGLSEDDLFTLSCNRQGTLWEEMMTSSHHEELGYLRNVIALAETSGPYAFFSTLLQTPCPAHPQSGLTAMINRLGEDCLDPLEEFLNRVLAAQDREFLSLQELIHALANDDGQIKREMEEAGEAVRIMTVHGAKGLQAPIIILPDTTRANSGKTSDRLIWPDKTGLRVPLWCPRKTGECTAFSAASLRLEDQLDDEYRRLLYVALTRAEDQLYIGGTQGTKKFKEDSWYPAIRSAMENISGTIHDADNDVLTLSNGRTADPDKIEDKKRQFLALQGLPDWAHHASIAEETPPRPLQPSRPSQPDPSVLSPLSGTGTQRYKRGTIIHTLLQMLPDIEPQNRIEAAMRFLSSPVHALDDSQRQEILETTINVLDHPVFGRIFGEGSMAEVPISGMLDPQTRISGQIDRILITPKTIYIIDYKTNRPSPERVEDVPEIYIQQMRSYARTLSMIYPERQIRTALLWTDGPKLMEII